MTDPLARLTAALADRYRIDRELGSGGMARVYLAHDIRQDRPVAIKVLKPGLALELGPERFLNEIATTANLRHPHILPLYESGESDGFLFYVMPHIAGESLRDRLTREKQLPIDDAVQITREVADALQYAHAHDVVHRDIKPANILIEGGHAMVADFGVARAVHGTATPRLTGSGMSVGTPTYMSPEQAAGDRELDGRSDQYALGCVLYELLAGQPPFTGATAESLIRQHILTPPPPVTNLRPSTPGHVKAALHRALAKAPADRFRSMAHFADALAPVAPPAHAVTEPRSGTARPRIARRYIIIALLLLAAAIVLIAVEWRRGRKTIELGRRTQVTRDPGLEIDPALSPDGKFVAYSDARGALMVRPVGGGDAVRVIRDGDGRGRWPAWDPGGQRLFLLSPRGVETVPALGGSPHLIIAEADPRRGMAPAPDGREVAYVSHDSLFVKPVDDGTRRLVTTAHEMHSPAWSPDRRWIAFVSGNPQFVRTTDLGNIASSSVQVVRATGGTPVRVSDDRSANVSPAWTASGDLLFVSDRDGSRDIYQIALSASGAPAGAATRLTTGLNVLGIGTSADGSRLTYSSFAETSNAWSLPIPATGTATIAQATRVTSGNQTIENIDVSRDGKWLGFGAVVAATSQLYRVRLDRPGAEPQPLTTDSVSSYWFSWSPDGREVAFHRFRSERRQAFVISVDSGGPVAVTDGSEDIRSPEWSPDGRQLLLLANWATHPALYLVTRDPGGRWSRPSAIPVVLGHDTVPAGLSAWSPDGSQLACGCGPGGLLVVPVHGGAARRLASPFPTEGWAFPQWSADGKTVYHVSEDSTGVTGVAAVPLSGSGARMVVRFDESRPWHRFGFRVRNGTMYFTLGDQQSDVWVADIGRKPE